MGKDQNRLVQCSWLVQIEGSGVRFECHLCKWWMRAVLVFSVYWYFERERERERGLLRSEETKGVVSMGFGNLESFLYIYLFASLLLCSVVFWKFLFGKWPNENFLITWRSKYPSQHWLTYLKVYLDINYYWKLKIL